MAAAATSAYVPHALDTLRDSFSLHLDATRSEKTTRIDLAALDALIGHLECLYGFFVTVACGFFVLASAL